MVNTTRLRSSGGNFSDITRVNSELTSADSHVGWRGSNSYSLSVTLTPTDFLGGQLRVTLLVWSETTTRFRFARAGNAVTIARMSRGLTVISKSRLSTVLI